MHAPHKTLHSQLMLRCRCPGWHISCCISLKDRAEASIPLDMMWSISNWCELQTWKLGKDLQDVGISRMCSWNYFEWHSSTKHCNSAGRGVARAGKAGPLAQGKADPLLLKGRAQEGRERKLTGARATAAARTRGHSAWGKRHVAKAGKGSFSTEPAPKAANKSNGALAALSNVTKVHTPYMPP